MQLMFNVLSHPGRPREPFCTPWKAQELIWRRRKGQPAQKCKFNVLSHPGNASQRISANSALEGLEGRSGGFGNASQRKSANSTLEGLKSQSGSFGNGSQCKSANSTLEGLESWSGSFGNGSQCKSANSTLDSFGNGSQCKSANSHLQKCKFTLLGLLPSKSGPFHGHFRPCLEQPPNRKWNISV